MCPLVNKKLAAKINLAANFFEVKSYTERGR